MLQSGIEEYSAHFYVGYVWRTKWLPTVIRPLYKFVQWILDFFYITIILDMRIFFHRDEFFTHLTTHDDTLNMTMAFSVPDHIITVHAQFNVLIKSVLLFCNQYQSLDAIVSQFLHNKLVSRRNIPLLRNITLLGIIKLTVNTPRFP